MTIKELLFAVFMIIVLLGAVIFGGDMHGVKKYDCSIAEISPDYPVEVKNACRRIRLEKSKE
jgi:hypothetical protein